MLELAKLASDPSTIKAVAEKSEGLIKGLFGKAFTEVGEMIADQVRLRRFKNQITIFEKANSLIKESNVDFQKVNLKVLAPLIEYASLEEDANLQDRWANLIKNILSRPTTVIQQQNAISILNKISNDEALILDHIYKSLQKKRQSSADEFKKRESLYNNLENSILGKIEGYPINNFSFKIKDIVNKLKLDQDDSETQISNLIALGTLKYEIEVDINSAEKSSEDPEDKDIDIDLDVEDYNKIKMTKMGFVFVRLCTE